LTNVFLFASRRSECEEERKFGEGPRETPRKRWVKEKTEFLSLPGLFSSQLESTPSQLPADIRGVERGASFLELSPNMTPFIRKGNN